MSAGIVIPGQPSGEEADVGDDDPRLGAGEGCFEVFGEAPATAEPCEGSLDDPATGQQHEAFGFVGPFDDLNGPRAHRAEPAFQLLASVAAIGEDVAQPWIAVTDRLQHGRCAVTVLNVGAVHDEAD